MTRFLRNSHRRIWLMLALVLPLGIIASWLVVPDEEPVVMLTRADQPLLPVIQAKSESLEHCIHIRSSMDKKEWQLEWKNKLPLTVPSAVIYQTPGGQTNVHNAWLVGRIEATGHYVFHLQKESALHKQLNLLLYDFIHERVIDSLTFNIKQ